MDEESRKIPPCPPLPAQQYSLAPDMYFGWKPKNLTSGAPVPIQFYEEELPHVQDPTTQEDLPAIYYGFRPTDSLILHRTLSRTYSFNQNHPLMSAYEFLSTRNAKRPIYLHRPFQGMQLTCSGLHFDSRFECGNLDKVVMVSEDEYDLYLRSDTNTTWHYQWFFFAVANIKRERKVRFNLVNCSRNNTLFEQGMRPVGRVGESGHWERVGENLKYEASKLNPLLKKGKFMMLSFEYDFSGTETTMYFAESEPYSYTQLLTLIADLRKLSPTLITRSALCKTIGGIEVPLLTVTNSTVAEACKKFIIVTGRVHPSETVASWKMDGFLRFLCSNETEAELLRERFTFKIVPMLNPDGVVSGNSRTSLTGEDLNRQFSSPDASLYPVNTSILQLVDSLVAKGKNRVLCYVDLHGHSKRKGAFMYGPYFPLHNENYFKVRIIPKLLSELTPIFRFYSCQFRFENYKKGSARIVMSREYGLTNCFTFETSLHGYINEAKQTVPYHTGDLRELGEMLAGSFLIFDDLMREAKIAKQRRAKERLKKLSKRKDQSSHLISAKERVTSCSTIAPVIPASANSRSERRYEDMVQELREDEALDKQNEHAGSESESGEEEDEEEKARHVDIMRHIQEFRKLANSDNPYGGEALFEAALKSCKSSAKHANTPSRRKVKAPILPNLSILKTPKDIRLSVDSSERRRWMRGRERAKQVENSSSQNSFGVAKEMLQESVLHDEHIREISDSVASALKSRGQRNLSGNKRHRNQEKE